MKKVDNLFPDLSSAKLIAVDIETRDDDLVAKGPGTYRDGYIAGVAVATDDGFSNYYPIRHEDGENLDPKKVLKWLGRELGRKSQRKVGANLLYDFDYLEKAGVKIVGPWADVQIAEPLVNENLQGFYNLGDISVRYLEGESKAEDEITQECARRGYKGDPKKHLWRLPGSVVAKYAIQDVLLPLKILPLQEKLLAAEGMTELFDLESRLLPLVLRMRQNGVRIDTKKLDDSIVAFRKKLVETKAGLDAIAGKNISVWNARELGGMFDSLGIPYPRTPKTDAPSFTKPWLETVNHSVAKMILECRGTDKFISTFLVGQMQEQLVDGRIHGSFNPMKSDEYGTVTGRFSSSHPNLQFIPARDAVLGPLCRSIFIPEEGCDWGKADYNQAEFRIFSHYALGEGAAEFRSEYQKNPKIDFHQQCADRAGLVGKAGRQKAKTINFGVIYGMGTKKTAAQLKLPVDEAQGFLDKYYAAFPFARNTLRVASDRANERGWVKTILGRRRRFEEWEPSDWDLSRAFGGPFPTRDGALSAVRTAQERARADGERPPRSGVRRTGTHKALNFVIQGTAADLMKKSMVDIFEAGVFDVIIPHITVHDDLGSSVPRTRAGKEAWAESVRIMETSIPFSVPILVDAKLQKNWGEE